MSAKIEEQLEEVYNEFKDYMNDEKWFPTLHKMCKGCESWCGEGHDYSECREKACFKHFLGYAYLNWTNTW